MALVLLLTGCAPSDTPNSKSIESKLFSRAQVIGERGGGAGQFNKPRSVAVDGNDNIFVVDMTGRVQKFTPEGEYLLSWQMPETDKGKAKGMCMDVNGDILLVEPHYTRVNHFSPDGKLVHQWGDTGTNNGQLIFPRGIAVAPDGAIWVSEYAFAERIQKFSPGATNFLLSVGSPGDGPSQFNRAEGIGVDRDGNLYAADSCNHRIQVFSADGKFLRQYGHAGNQPGEMSYPYDIRVDAGGRQFVCEFGNSRIQVFDRNDQLIEVIGASGAEPGMFNNPWSIALDSKGNLIVADSQNHRVQKLWRKKQTASATQRARNGQQSRTVFQTVSREREQACRTTTDGSGLSTDDSRIGPLNRNRSAAVCQAPAAAATLSSGPAAAGSPTTAALQFIEGPSAAIEKSGPDRRQATDAVSLSLGRGIKGDGYPGDRSASGLLLSAHPRLVASSTAPHSELHLPRLS